MTSDPSLQEFFRVLGGGFGRRICKVGKGAQLENLLFYCFQTLASSVTKTDNFEK